MKYRPTLLFVSLFSILFLPGCDVIVGIFKAGFWTAILLIILIVGLALYAFIKIGKD